MNALPQPAPLRGYWASLASGRASHALLLLGPTGSGKRLLARQAAAALLCTARNSDGSACGACAGCLLSQAGTHPDCVVPQPEKSSLSVDEVRALLGDLARQPFMGGMRAVVLEHADTLNPQAQNALLKTLEEPSDNTVFFLLAREESAVLPTIRSRCRILRLSPDAAAASALLAGEEMQSALPHARRIASLRSPADLPAVWQFVKEEKDNAQPILHWLELWHLDALHASAGLAADTFEGAEAAERFTTNGLRIIIEEIVTTRKRLHANVAWQTAIEPLLWAIADKAAPRAAEGVRK